MQIKEHIYIDSRKIYRTVLEKKVVQMCTAGVVTRNEKWYKFIPLSCNWC